MKKLILGSILCMSCFSMAEDIELYVGSAAQRTGGDPKVLIIFDNSGSMRAAIAGKPPYDPDRVYPVTGDLNDGGPPAIYYTKGLGIDNSIPIPDGPNERRRFLNEINGCQSSWQILADVGFYTGFFREYKYRGASGAWQPVPDNNGLNIDVIDCHADIENNIIINAADVEPGVPVDGLGRGNAPDYYSDLNDPEGGTRPIFNTGEMVTLYTENYLRWAQADADDIGGEVEISRLERAQETITNFIVSNPNIDFGLQVFNINHSGENHRDGGRIVFCIQNMDLTAKTDLLDIVNNQLDAETNTPLCESLYEASLYFGGKAVDFGDNDSSIGGYTPNTPPRDTSVESGANYITPFDGCTKEIYTILITDGAPTVDNAANDKIAGLSATTYSTTTITLVVDADGNPVLDEDGNQVETSSTASVTSHLASLAYHMKTHDLVNGDVASAEEIRENDFSRIKNSTLSTIAFDFPTGDLAENDPPGAKLLKDAATKGGGKYYDAGSADDLRDALQDFIFNISKTHGSFTSPAVATNNFDRTRTLDSVYYAMFQPDQGPRWYGNIKKLRVTSDGIKDKNNNSAINNEGNIAETATTFWTTGPADGNAVDKGGVAQMLRVKANRRVLSDVKLDNGKLLPLNQTNALNTYLTTAALADELNVVDDVAHQNIDDMLNWAKGANVDQVAVEGDIPDIRYDVFGDPLHSKPLVLNYGTEDSADIRIVVGTNSGMLHMFKDEGETVDEAWAFMPKEFLKNISALRDNFPSPEKIYGIDGTATVYISDVNGNGAIDEGTDKVWLFFGLRRGGNSYYALDLSYKNDPKLMWHKTFAGAGQSWSKPKISLSKINMSGDSGKPVLIFGAGYATSKDALGVGGDDLVGTGIYMLDAETGNLVWRLSTEDGLTDITTAFSGTDGIAAKIATLDSDFDGFADRIYAGDTGGNVWRVDMPGTTISDWTVVQLASLGSSVDNENDRRFFSAPTVVRALITETVTTTVTQEDGTEVVSIDRFDRPYEAVLIGSGDINNPLGTDTLDKYFMIKDSNIITRSLTGDDVPTVIEMGALKDYTLNPFQGLTGEALLVEQLDASSKSGWYIDLIGSGEKSTSSSLVYSGVVYFNTYTPAAPPEGEEVCSAQPGGGLLYAVDLSLGTSIWRNNEGDGEEGDGEGTYYRTRDTGEQLLTEDGSPLMVICDGDECIASTIGPDVIQLNGNPPETLRTYLYTTEN